MSQTRFPLLILRRPDGYTGIHLENLSYEEIFDALEEVFSGRCLLITSLRGSGDLDAMPADKAVLSLKKSGIRAERIEDTEFITIPSGEVEAFLKSPQINDFWQASFAPLDELPTRERLELYGVKAGESLGASNMAAPFFVDAWGPESYLCTRDPDHKQRTINFIFQRALAKAAKVDRKDKTNPLLNMNFADFFEIDLENHLAYYGVKQRRGITTVTKEDPQKKVRQIYTWAEDSWTKSEVKKIPLPLRAVRASGKATLVTFLFPFVLILGIISAILHGFKNLFKRFSSSSQKKTGNSTP